MSVKRAAELTPGDMVLVAPGDVRTVELVEFHDRAIDAHGTTGVRVWWQDWPGRSLLAADKEMEIR